MDAWNWITVEIKGNIRDGEWLHADILGAPAGVFPRTVHLKEKWPLSALFYLRHGPRVVRCLETD